MFYLVGNFRTSSLGTTSQVTLKELLWGGWGWGERGSVHTEVCNKGQVVWTSKVVLWIKENQIPQVKEFSTFLCLGLCKCLGLLKSLLSYASQLSGASTLFSLHFSSVLTTGSGCSPMASGLQVCFSSPGGLESPMTVTALFISLAGNTPFLTFIGGFSCSLGLPVSLAFSCLCVPGPVSDFTLETPEFVNQHKLHAWYTLDFPHVFPGGNKEGLNKF